jgi:hypothetical protein
MDIESNEFVKYMLLLSSQGRNNSVYGNEYICDNHERYCTGEYKQFENKTECMNYMTELPQWSPSCVEEGRNTYLDGNSQMCKFKHSQLISIDKNHCFHIGPGNPDTKGHRKCVDEKCLLYPKGGPSLEYFLAFDEKMDQCNTYIDSINKTLKELPFIEKC